MRPLTIPTVGAARIIADRGSALYQPYDEGTRAVVLGVHDRHGDTVDIVAWQIDKPADWWRRTGAAVVLGEGEVERAAFLGLPLYLVPTPLAWFRNHLPGGRWPAACILDWKEDPRLICNGVTHVDCATPALATRLGNRLSTPQPAPFQVTASYGACNVAA